MPLFLADEMLTRLARWLRFAGYDCELSQGGHSDEALLNYARENHRILLTSAAALGRMYPDEVIHVESGGEMDTLRDVVQHWPLDFTRTAFTRCSVCNVPVENVTAEDAGSEVPPAIVERKLPLSRCPQCHCVYWPGGHHARILAKLESLRSG